MIEDHIHCSICGHAIVTQIKCAGGKTKPAEIFAIDKPIVVPMAGGRLGIAVENVPVCQDCRGDVESAAEKIRQQVQEQATAAAARPRLIVPGKGRPQ